MSAPENHGVDCACPDCRLALVLFEALEASMDERKVTPTYMFADVRAAASAALAAGWTLPTPGIEIEWGWRSLRNPGLVMSPISEKSARKAAAGPADVEAICREVGPWKVVES